MPKRTNRRRDALNHEAMLRVAEALHAIRHEEEVRALLDDLAEGAALEGRVENLEDRVRALEEE